MQEVLMFIMIKTRMNRNGNAVYAEKSKNIAGLQFPADNIKKILRVNSVVVRI
ncbi:hypothetical protein SDC9_207557 [bioreactor metagenome]|uniref:Uncharacterized protein n=1 Tax=bioreactor metagenome TaxID=1076179 RepID=A0A645J801_9ZZZZ